MIEACARLRTHYSHASCRRIVWGSCVFMWVGVCVLHTLLPGAYVYYQYHAWATIIAHGERLRDPVSRGIAKCHNPAHPGLDLVTMSPSVCTASRSRTVCCGVVYLSGLRRLRETEMNSGLQEPRRLSPRMTRHVNITVCSI